MPETNEFDFSTTVADDRMLGTICRLDRLTIDSI
jgi:hypothetical protein